MALVVPINPNTQKMQKPSKEQQEKVVAGVGGTAAATTTATAWAKNGARLEAKVQRTLSGAQKVANAASTEKMMGFWASFREDVRFYTNDIIQRLGKLKSAKFIGPLINNPVSRGLAGVAGGALAFFVMITGVSKMFKTGEIAVDDLKNQINEFRTVA